MRILLISEDPRGVNIGGVPTYTYPLAQRLAERGNEVLYLSSGGYQHDYDWKLRPRWKRSRDGQLNRTTLGNAASVGLHPGRPLLDVDNRDRARIVSEAARFKPDVIHVHSVLGIPLSALKPLSSLAPVIYSCHEYFVICQRGNLITRDGVNCSSFPTGIDCATCMGHRVDPRRHKARALVKSLPGGIGQRIIDGFEGATGMGLEVAPRLVGEGDPSAVGAGSGSVEAVVRRGYEQRTREAVRALNEDCTEVWAVSGSVRENLELAGVRPERIEVVHIGSSSAEMTPRMPLPGLDEGGDPTFIFFGGFNPGKGSKVLMEALERLPDPPRVEWMGPTDRDDRHAAIRAGAPASVVFRGKVGRDAVIAALGRADIMLAPSVAADTSPQAVLEALAAGRPVIGSRMGGIPDFVEDGVNGLLVPPGDVGLLADAIERVRQAGALKGLADGVRPPLSVEQHVEDLERRYRKLVNDPGLATKPARSPHADSGKAGAAP